jgi:hypothetical protein
MYRITKLVEECVDELANTARNIKHTRRKTITLRPAASYIKQKYADRYRLPHYFRVNDICDDAIANGFLKAGITFDPNGKDIDGITEVDNLEITSKGREFISAFPFGFLEELFGKRKFIGGVFSGLLIALIIGVTTVILRHLHL